MSLLFGKRLVAARTMAGLSLQKLADALEGTLTRQALHKYEQGTALPNSKNLIAIAHVLNVPVDFFFSEPAPFPGLSEIEFRKRTRLTQSEQASVIEKCTEILGRYLELEHLLGEEKLPRHFSFDGLVRNSEDAEMAAEALRRDWNLGQDPIPGVMRMLEDHGYKVIGIEAPLAFDGLKANAGQHRVIVVNMAFDVCRRRFTALHELAHHLLVFPDDLPEKERENYCHTFAGAVLLPASQAKEILKMHRTNFYLPELQLIKSEWGISIAAIFARARQAGLISEHVYTRYHRQYRARGYYQDEPGTYPAAEQANRFELMWYRALAEERISLAEAARLTNLTMGEIREKILQPA